MALTKSQLKHFKHWMEDGNVSKNNDGTYSTQDAQFRNKLKNLNELKKYFKKEFAVDDYANGGDVGDFKLNKGLLLQDFNKIEESGLFNDVHINTEGIEIIGGTESTYPHKNYEVKESGKHFEVSDIMDLLKKIPNRNYAYRVKKEIMENDSSEDNLEDYDDENYYTYSDIKFVLTPIKLSKTKMAKGGGVGGKLKKSKVNITNDMRGEDSDDYGTFEIYKNGGNIEVKVVNSDKQYNEKQYDWILGDKDKDSVANADDVKPLDKNIKERIDEPTITTGIKNLISLKKSLDSTMYSFIEDLKNVAPNNSKIYARTKTPYSVLDKLIKKRLSTITDLIGTTIVTNDKKELDAVKNYVESGKIGKVVEMEDMYEKPKQGYRAYHFLIERNGMTIELQVKTKRQKALNELSHEPYKLGKLNSTVNLKMTELANRADEGDKNAIKEYNDFMNQPNVEKLFYADGGNKMAKGGEIDYSEWDKPRYSTHEDYERIHKEVEKKDILKNRENYQLFTKWWYDGGDKIAMKKYGDDMNVAWAESYEDFKDAILKGKSMADGGGINKQVYTYTDKNLEGRYATRFIRSAGENGLGKYVERLSDTEVKITVPSDKKESEELLEIVEFSIGRHNLVPFHANGGSIEDENREMVLNENNQIIHHTKELPIAVKGKRVPAWVVTKVHESASDLSDATHYMDGQKMARGGEIGKEINFEYEYAGKSKLKGTGKILSKNGNYYNIMVTKGLMKGKTTDIHESMIIGKMEDGGGLENIDAKFNYELKVQEDYPYKNIANRWLQDNSKDSLKYKLALLLLREKKNPDEILGIKNDSQYGTLLRSLEKAKGESKHEMSFRTNNYTLAEAEKWARESLRDIFYVHGELMAKGGEVNNPSKKEMLNYLNMYFDNYSELRTIAVEEDNILTRKMLNSLDDELLELAYEDAKYEIKADTQYADGGQVDDIQKKIEYAKTLKVGDEFSYKDSGRLRPTKDIVYYIFNDDPINFIGIKERDEDDRSYVEKVQTIKIFVPEKTDSDTKMANGGSVSKRGGNFNVGDKVMVDDSGYSKSFQGFDLSKPATILTKNKVKTSQGIKYSYSIELADGRKPFNNAMENKLTLADTQYAKGGGVKKRIVVVWDEGYGKVINDLYNQWNNVKTQVQYDKWVSKVKETKFGTYGNIPFEEVLEKFDFDNAPINSFHLKTFKVELKNALNKYEDGGLMDSQQGIDLFEDYENIPANVQSILDNHEDAFMDGDYKELQKALTQLKKIGYTFEYDLDGQAYDLRPIGTKGKSEIEEYEEGTEAFKQGGNVDSSATKLNKLGIRTSDEFGDEFRDFLDDLEENNDGEYIGYRLDLPNNELTLIQEKGTKTVSILDYSEFPKDKTWRIEKHSIIHYKEGGSMTNKNQTTMTQEHIDKFVRGANSTDETAREISTRKLKEAGLDKNGKPLESKKAMAKSKSEPTPKYKVGDILNHKDSGETYKVKIEAVTGWTGDGHRYHVEFLDENLKPLNKFAKSYDDKLSKPKTSTKAKTPSEALIKKDVSDKQEPKKDSKETEDEYCKRIIAEARARKLKAKKIAKKSANKPAVTKATERVERTHESIEKQIETGKLKKEQIEKIIAETEDLLRMLKKALKSL
jgi:hypothetical protein